MKSRSFPLVGITLSYREATQPVREPVALAPAEVERALLRWRSAGVTGFILSTCQRTELYFRADGVAMHAILVAFHDRDPRAVARALGAAKVRSGSDAARHLLRVAAGLDSSAVGEHEVIGQVRRAVVLARGLGALDTLTNRVGDAALLAGKRVRRETTIALHPASLASLALNEAAARMGALDNRRVVVIGAGHMARVALRELRAAAVTDVRVAGRTPAHAAATAQLFGACTVPWTQRASAVADADLVVCCAGAPHPVLTAEMLADARAQRAVAGLAPAAMIDLAVPRGIARAEHGTPDANVIDLDWLASRGDRGTTLMAGAIAAAEAIVDDETQRLGAWWTRRTVEGAHNMLEERRRAAS